MKAAWLSKLNWTGLLTILLSNATLLVDNGVIPAEYVALFGSIIGTLTMLLRTFAATPTLTVGGKAMSTPK